MSILDAALRNGLPGKPDIERLVVGSAMLDAANNLPCIMSLLKPTDFSVQQHAEVFTKLCEMWQDGRPIDRVTVGYEMHNSGRLAAVGGVSYLVDMCDGLPEIYNLDAYCKILVEQSVLRRCIVTLASHLSALCSSGAGVDEVAAAKAAVADLDAETQTDRCGFVHVGDVIRNEDGGGVNEFLSPSERAVGIPWPWPNMTASVGGMRPGQVVVVSAGTGVGKTTFAAQAILNAATLGKSVGIVTLEMSRDEQIIKFLCQRGGVCLSRWMQGNPDAADRSRMIKAANALKDASIYVDDRESLTPAMLDAALAGLRHDPPKVLMVDYCQLMDSGLRTGDASREQHIAHISRSLKRLARKYNLCVLALSQVNDNGSTRESKAIENDATIVMLLERTEGSSVRVKFRKSRFSARSEMYLWFDGATGIFTEVDA